MQEYSLNWMIGTTSYGKSYFSKKGALRAFTNKLKEFQGKDIAVRLYEAHYDKPSVLIRKVNAAD